MPKTRNKKHKQSPAQTSPRTVNRKSLLWVAVIAAIVLIGAAVVAMLNAKETDTAPATQATRSQPQPPQPATPTPLAPAANTNAAAPAPDPKATAKTLPKMETMEVAKAVMVTVELDFGPKVPTIAEALRDVERRYAPEDGQGRTFTILDAYGEPTSDGKLHMSMHVSSEKPGAGSLIFRRTGEILWQSKITPASTPPQAKALDIIIDNGSGTGQRIDISGSPASILDARVRNLGMSVRLYWPDGAEREVTFIYSACGCPVKVMVRRTGERTVRTKDMPVIFPDDPSAVATISRLMKW